MSQKRNIVVENYTQGTMCRTNLECRTPTERCIRRRIDINLCDGA
jgi:hypothetical protein